MIINIERRGDPFDITQKQLDGGEIETTFGPSWQWHWFLQGNDGGLLDESTETDGFDTAEDAIADFGQSHDVAEFGEFADETVTLKQASTQQI